MASVPAKGMVHNSANIEQADHQPTRRSTLSSAAKIHTALEQNVITSGRDTNIHIEMNGLQQRGEAETLSIEAMRKIADWLSPLNYHQIQKDIFEKVTPGTAAWILDDPAFMEWRAGEIKTLWGTGIPGAGKSCLISFIVNHLVHQEHATVIYIYCQDKDQLSSADILACLLKQLVENSDQVAFYISSTLYKRCLQMDTKPSKAELLKALAGAVLKVPDLILVIDALDEVKEEVHSELISNLISLQIPLLLTSRPYIILTNIESNLKIQPPDQDLYTFILFYLSSMPRLKPFFKEPAIQKEITHSLCKKCHGIFLLAALQLNTVASAGIINIPTLREAINKLPTTLDDQYQLILDRIQEQSQVERDLACQAILIVMHATESLQAEVLLEALTVNTCTGYLDQESHTTVETLMRVSMGFLSVNQSNRSKQNQDQTEDTQKITTIQLIYHSAQAFLQEQPDFLAEKSHTAIADASAIYLLCAKLELHKITTISGLESEDITVAYPFLSYACMNIGYHTFKATEHTQDMLPVHVTQLLQKQGSMPLPLSLLGDYLDHAQAIHFAVLYGLEIPSLPMQTPLSTGNRSVLGCSSLFYACLGGHATLANQITQSLQACIAIGYPTTFGATVLHAACSSGNLDIIQLLLPMVSQKKSSWGYAGIPILARMQDGQTALHLATKNGHTTTVKELLAHVICKEKKRLGMTRNNCSVLSETINAKTNTNTTLLHMATRNGHTSIVQLLLSSPGVDINAEDNEKWTPLHLAAYNGHQAVVELLLAFSEININAMAVNQFTPLHVAAQNGHLAVVQMLLAFSGIDINARASLEFTPLHIASQNGHLAVVQLLLASSGIDIKARTEGELTPLHLAAQNGHQAVVQLLFAFPEIDINARIATQHTPLHVAAGYGHQAVVELLLASPEININATEEAQFTPLHFAAQNGHQAVVQLLVAFPGIDINARMATQHTPLHIAAKDGHQAVVQLLLASPEININATDETQFTPLHFAAQYGHQAVVQLLLAFPGIDINARNKDQFTPLHIATQNGHLAVVQLLLTCPGIDIHARATKQFTPLHIAAQNSHQAVVQLLLASLGIDINAREKDQWTPLHIAAQGGHQAVAQLLLASPGIDINARTATQHTPLHIAALKGHQAVVQLLLASPGIDINARVGEFGTSLHIAAFWGHQAVGQLLLDSPGIEINIKDKLGYTEVDLAILEGHHHVAQLLHSYGCKATTAEDDKAEAESIVDNNDKLEHNEDDEEEEEHPVEAAVEEMNGGQVDV